MGLLHVPVTHEDIENGYAPASRSKVNRSLPCGGPKLKQTLGQEDLRMPHFGPISTQNFVKCGQNVGKQKTGLTV